MLRSFTEPNHSTKRQNLSFFADIDYRWAKPTRYACLVASANRYAVSSRLPPDCIVLVSGGRVFRVPVTPRALSSGGGASGVCAFGLHQNRVAANRRWGASDAGLARSRIRHPALLLFGTQYWPVLLVANFAGILQEGIPWLPSVGAAVAAIGRAMVGVWIFSAVAKLKSRFGHFVDLAGVVLAALLAPVVSTTLGTVTFLLTNAFPLGDHWQDVAGRYWVSDFLGIVTTMPVLLALVRALAERDRKREQRFPFLSAGLFAVAVVLGCYAVFFRPEAARLLFSVFLFIFVAAAWLGPLSARITALAISAAAVWATHLGLGTFASGTLSENLQNLDLFLVAVSLTGVALGAFRSSGSGAPGRRSCCADGF